MPARIPVVFGVNGYAAIERIAPAPYVEAMLAQAALDRRDLDRAESHAKRLPQSPVRDELLGRIAAARGDEAAAEQYFVAAADVFAIRTEVNRLSSSDPAAAFRIESRLRDRLQQTATHPDALADAYWRLGRLDTQLGYANARQRRTWFETGMRDYAQAVALAPLAEKYLIAAGSQSLNLNDAKQAQTYFQRAAEANPASADAYAGLGMSAYRLGNLAEARGYAAQARSYDPHSHFLRHLEALLK